MCMEQWLRIHVIFVYVFLHMREWMDATDREESRHEFLVSPATYERARRFNEMVIFLKRAKRTLMFPISTQAQSFLQISHDMFHLFLSDLTANGRKHVVAHEADFKLLTAMLLDVMGHPKVTFGYT